MPSGEVHWHEGMFLRQHHFLTEHRQVLRLMQLDGKWGQHHNWGLRSIDLNIDALANFRFSVTALEARLRDGTLVEVPRDGKLAEIDLKPALETHRKVTVHLALPVLKSSSANVSEDGPASGMRYYLINQQLEDENLGVNPQPIPIRRLNIRLLLSTESLAGYDTVPIARVEKSERAEATPQLDATYFPPVIACDAWRDLAIGVLQAIYDRIGRKIEKLAGQAVSRGLDLDNLDSQGQKGTLSFAQLRAFNEAYAYLSNMAFLEGLHPLPVYLELCRMVGQLSIFHSRRRPPELPRYDHDDLGGCFLRVKNYLNELIDIAPEPDYEARDFVGRGLRMSVDIQPDWLNRNVPMYIGVTSPLRPEECASQLERLGMKVSSLERVEDIYRRRDIGLQFSQVPLASLPAALPRDAGPSMLLTYFQINRELQPAEWEHVRSSGTLAIRFKEDDVVGEIDGKTQVTLRLSKEMSFRFTLYVLVRGGGQSKSDAGSRS
jgi:type VI secretion system protein ImpJ